MSYRLSTTLRRLLTAAILLPGISQSPAQDTFTARFENDAGGTWLVYPTIPGWHYKIEGSPTPAAAGFTYVPGSFRYGDGQDRRWWIAPPPPPAIAPDPPPPPRSYHSLHVTIYVATDPGVHMVEIFHGNGDHSWSRRMTANLPVRVNANGEPLPMTPFFSIGNSPTESWTLSGSVRPRLFDDFLSDPNAAPFVTGTPEDVDYQFLLAHWDEIVSHATPTPSDAAQAPPAPPPGTPPPPPPDPDVRRFYRVSQTAIDSNGNGLYDWWELQNAYAAFAVSGDPAYADPNGDSDGDGLSNLSEYNAGTDPHNPDTDGDYTNDADEVFYETDPLSKRSAPLLITSMARSLWIPINWLDDTAHAQNYWHDWNFSMENPQGTPPFAGLIYAPDGNGTADGDLHWQGLPDFHTITSRLESKVPFVNPPPPWFLAQARPDHHPRHAHGEGEIKYESGLTIWHRRVWLRGAAPADADLLIPVKVKTYPNRVAEPDTFTSEIKYLRMAGGINITADYVDCPATIIIALSDN